MSTTRKSINPDDIMRTPSYIRGFRTHQSSYCFFKWKKHTTSGSNQYRAIKKYCVDHEYALTFPEYNDVVFEIFKTIADLWLEGKKVPFPHNMGNFQINKFVSKCSNSHFLPAKKFYRLTDGYDIKLNWNKKDTVRGGARMKYIMLYMAHFNNYNWIDIMDHKEDSKSLSGYMRKRIVKEPHLLYNLKNEYGKWNKKFR